MEQSDRETLKKYNITIYLFDDDLWERDGIYIHELRTMFIKKSLSNEKIHQIILHELGHINHNPKNYERLLLKYENQANRFMICKLIEKALDQLDDPRDFNYLGFMEYHDLHTMTDEIMVKEEFAKIMEEKGYW